MERKELVCDCNIIHEDAVNMITDTASDDPRKDMKFKEVLNANKIYSRKNPCFINKGFSFFSAFYIQ